jgi:hypothetical protein
LYKTNISPTLFINSHWTEGSCDIENCGYTCSTADSVWVHSKMYLHSDKCWLSNKLLQQEFQPLIWLIFCVKCSIFIKFVFEMWEFIVKAGHDYRWTEDEEVDLASFKNDMGKRALRSLNIRIIYPQMLNFSFRLKLWEDSPVSKLFSLVAAGVLCY